MIKDIIVSHINNDETIINLFVSEFQILSRIFQKVEEEVDTSLFITESELNSEENLKNKFLLSDNKVYKCIFNKISNFDQSIWKPYKEIYAVMSYIPEMGDCLCFIDKYSETYQSKMNHETYNKQFKVFHSNTILRFLVLPNTNLETAPKLCSPTLKLITNLTFDTEYQYTNVEKTYKDIVKNWRDFWIPTIQLTCDDTIQSNQYITFSIKAFHKDNQVCLDEVNYYIEPIQGYTPNKEIKMINGEGIGKIYALGLNPGDKLRFKINSKYWTDLAEKVLTVV